MSIQGYIGANWPLIVIIIGFWLLLLGNIFLSKEKVSGFRNIIYMIVFFSIVDYIEDWLASRDTYTIWRSILTATKYSVPQLVLAQTTTILFDRVKKYIYIPAVITIAINYSSIFNHIVFVIHKNDNSFGRGRLGYLPFVCAAIYLAFTLYMILFNEEGKRRQDRYVIYYIILTAVVIILWPMITDNSNTEEYFCITVAIDEFIYYCFTLHQVTKRDPLTGLLNRHSYYSMIENDADHIDAVLAVDMNGLKYVNDNFGHEAGDLALKTISDVMKKAVDERHYIFRVGGDEFEIFCMKCDENQVRTLEQKIQEGLSKTEYSCSTGYEMVVDSSRIEDYIKRADEKMYISKEQYYAEHEEQARQPYANRNR